LVTRLVDYSGYKGGELDELPGELVMIDETHDRAQMNNYGIETNSSFQRQGVRRRLARTFATCAQGAWLLLAATPVIVIVCAIKG